MDPVPSGAGNINNAAIGTDRRLIVTYDIEITDSDANGNGTATTDGWFGVGFGFDDANTTGASGGDVVGFSGSRAGESEFALLTRTLGANPHSFWNDQTSTLFGANSLGGTPGDSSDGIDGSARITIDLSDAGILAGESAFVTYEIDNNADGFIDEIASDTIDWSDADNFVWLGSRFDTEHVVTNFVIESQQVPEPTSVALWLLLGSLASAFGYWRWKAKQ